MQFNTVFTGKNYIELDSVDSTNNYAANLINTTKVPDGTVIMAHYQENGRGQQGNEWHSNPGENLMCSVIYKTNLIAAKNVFVISQIAALAVKDTIDFFINESSLIKWPNDIYIGLKKVSGMLIENQWQGPQLTTIIGVGINVNQTNFLDYPRASSLSLIIGKSVEIKSVLKKFVENLEKHFFKIRERSLLDVQSAYRENMMFISKSQVFKSRLETFRGIIQGVNESGHLCIKKMDGSICYFELKEVEFIF